MKLLVQMFAYTSLYEQLVQMFAYTRLYEATCTNVCVH